MVERDAADFDGQVANTTPHKASANAAAWATVKGKRTLILVSDNNFNPLQFTQFIALTLD